MVSDEAVKQVAEAFTEAMNLTLKGDTFTLSVAPSGKPRVHDPTYVQLQQPVSTIAERYAAAALARHYGNTSTVSNEKTGFHSPTISICTFKDDELIQRVTLFVRYLQEILNKHYPLQPDEVMWEYVFRSVLDGFSPLAPQLYPTSGLGVTSIHDELLASSALNYMVRTSTQSCWRT